VPEIDPSGRDEFLRHFENVPRGTFWNNISRETISKLDRYAELLKEWNQKFNLIADSTFPIIWQRHFLDSAQMMKYIPEGAQTLADLGSGAGFPGMVLSIMGFPKVHLIESIGKKANFLREVVKQLGLNADVHQMRIESLHKFTFDVITARALKPLPQLLKYAKPLMKKESVGLFLKGKQVEDELTESAKYWKFDYELFPSLSDSSGRVIKIFNLK
jgi:16S rRNA (guanine527-N7)-methyltransferase